jgi:hypothetical protein
MRASKGGQLAAVDGTRAADTARRSRRHRGNDTGPIRKATPPIGNPYPADVRQWL